MTSATFLVLVLLAKIGVTFSNPLNNKEKEYTEVEMKVWGTGDYGSEIEDFADVEERLNQDTHDDSAGEYSGDDSDDEEDDGEGSGSSKSEEGSGYSEEKYPQQPPEYTEKPTQELSTVKDPVEMTESSLPASGARREEPFDENKDDDFEFINAEHKLDALIEDVKEVKQDVKEVKEDLKIVLGVEPSVYLL